MKLKTFEKLTYYEKSFANPVGGIPKESGIYYWVYWPNISKNINATDLEKKLLEYSKVNLLFSETIKGRYKYSAVISEQSYRDNGNIFGLSDTKKNRLLEYFRKDQKNIHFFIDFFERVCFSRPFYIGKANNLRTRLVSQHFKGTTEVMGQITNSGISRTEIYVGYELVNDTASERVNDIFEEIFSRKVKPGLTKKPN